MSKETIDGWLWTLGMVLLSSSEQDPRAERNLPQQSHSGLMKNKI